MMAVGGDDSILSTFVGKASSSDEDEDFEVEFNTFSLVKLMKFLKCEHSLEVRADCASF